MDILNRFRPYSRKSSLTGPDKSARLNTFPRKRKDEKNLFHSVKGKRHRLRRVTFIPYRPNIWRFIKSALKIEHNLHSDLTVFQFCVIAFAQNRSIINMEYVLQTGLQYGILLTFCLYMMSMFLISMPMYFIYLSMASYSKKGPVAFWDCLPLMKGFAISWALAVIMNVVENLRNAAACIYRLLLLHDFHDALKCKHAPSKGSTCIPAMNNNTKSSVTNCSFQFALRDFTTTNMPLNFNCVLNYFNTTVAVGLLVFTIWMSVRGLNAVKKLLQFTLIIGQGLFFVIMFVSFIVPPKFSVSIDIFALRLDPLFNLEYWSALTPITMYMLNIGDVLWLGRFKPDKIRPDIFTIILHILRQFYFVLIYCWMLRLAQDILANYGLTAACMALQTTLYIKTSIPDMLLRSYPSGIPCAAWYLVMAMLHVITAIYRMISLLDGFLELKVMRQNKKYLILAVFAAGFIYDLMYGFAKAHTLKKYWAKFFTRPWLSFQFVLQCFAIIHIYTIKRFMHDYQFTYNIIPGQAWVKLWQGVTLYGFLLIVVSGHWLLNLLSAFGDLKLSPVLYPTLVWILISLPTCVVSVLYTCKYLKKREIYRLTLPSASWGPADHLSWMDRAKFLPDRDIKYRHDSVTCTHNCLMKLDSYVVEKRIQKAQFGKLLRKYTDVIDKADYGDIYTSSDEDDGKLQNYSASKSDVFNKYSY